MFWFDYHWQIQQAVLPFWWPINFLLLCVALLALYFGYKKTIYAVVLTILALPLYLLRSTIGFLPFTFLELMILATVAGWLSKKISEKNFLLNNKKYFWPLLIITSAGTLSVFVSNNTIAAAGLWKAYIIEPMLFFLVLKDTLKDKKNRELTLYALGITTVTISILAIYQRFTGFAIAEPSWTNPADRRVTSIYTSPNAVGLFLAPITILYVGWILQEFKKWQKNSFKVCIITLNLLAIAFTFSQGTWLGLAAAIIFLLFFGWSKKWTSIILGALLLLILLFPPISAVAFPVITLQDASGQNRIFLWQTTWDYLTQNTQNFFLGAGLFSFPKILDQFRDPLKLEPLLYPHNIILNFWIELGLLGLFGFIYLLKNFFQPAIKKINHEKWLTLGIMAAMITIIVHGLIDVPYFKNDLAVLFWIIIALI